MSYWDKIGVCRPLSLLWCVYRGRLLNKLHKLLRQCKLIQQRWCSQGQRLFISGWSPDRTWCQMQTSPWLTAFCAIGKSLMFGWEDRAAAKWMLGALPGIKLMNPAEASGHHDTNTAWVVTHAQRGVFGFEKKRENIWNHKTVNACRLSFHLHTAHFLCATFLLGVTYVFLARVSLFRDSNDLKKEGTVHFSVFLTRCYCQTHSFF